MAGGIIVILGTLAALIWIGDWVGRHLPDALCEQKAATEISDAGGDEQPGLAAAFDTNQGTPSHKASPRQGL